MKKFTHEESAGLLEKSKNGDIEARNLLITQNMGLIYQVVNKMAANHPSKYDDILSLASMKTLEVINKWNPSKAKLSTFLYSVLRNELASSIAHMYFPVAVSPYTLRQLQRLDKEQIDQLPLAVKLRLISAQTFVSNRVDSEYNTPEYTRSFFDFTDSTVDEEIKKVFSLFYVLNHQQQTVLKLRFLQKMSLREIAQKIGGVCHERVRAILKLALRKLRAEYNLKYTEN